MVAKLKKSKQNLEDSKKAYEVFCSRPDIVKILKHIKCIGNHCQILTFEAFDQVRKNYEVKLSPHNAEIRGINCQIDNITKKRLEVISEIDKLAKLRDKLPNYDVKVIRDLDMKIKNLEKDKENIIMSVEKPELLKDYYSYMYYESDAKIIEREYNRYVNAVNPIKKHIALLENEIEKEL